MAHRGSVETPPRMGWRRGSPLMKTPGPTLVRARNGVLLVDVEDRFSEETNPVSTVATSWAEVFMESRVVGRFVMTLFRSKCLLGES